MINRNWSARLCARTNDFSPLEARPRHVRQNVPSWKRSRLCRIFQVSPRDPLHFSHRTLRRRPFSHLYLVFLSSPPALSVRRRVLFSYVFNAEANVIVTFRRPCAKRALSQTQAYVQGDTLDFIARCNSEIYRGARIFAAELRAHSRDNNPRAIRQICALSSRVLVNHKHTNIYICFITYIYITFYHLTLCRTNCRDSL